MLRLAIPMVKERGVFRVLLTPINDASRKVIEACGGQLETPATSVDVPGQGPRYWIQIGARDRKPAWPQGTAAKADLIIIHGAPGIGKTTVGRLLKKILKGAFLDLDWIRSNHLEETWRNKSPEEEKMSYRILIRTINEYLSHGYKNIVLNSADLKQLLGHEDLFRSIDYRVITLTADDSELRKRVLDPSRDSGWRDVEGSVVRNQRIVGRPLWRNEIRIDTTVQSPEATAQTIGALIHGTAYAG
jgi:broad-specificity NMP kinase